MTGKELMYVEDALGHVQYFQQKCQETAGQLRDPALKDQVRQMAQRQQRLLTAFLDVL